MAFADAQICTTSGCATQDNTASLQPGRDYFYRVAALGENEALSEPPSQPSTHTMRPFTPELLTPGAEATGVDWVPTYTLKTNLSAAEAHGARIDLVVSDVFTGQRSWAAPPLWMERRSDATVIRGLGTDERTYFHSDGSASLVNYNLASDILSVPHDLSRTRYGFEATPLQSNRRYSWLVNAGYAFRLQDPSLPQSASNPVVAYSVYADPDREKIVPGGATQSAADIHHFITKP